MNPDETLPDDFDPDVYLLLNPDVAAAGVDAIDHWRRHGRDEGRPWKRAPHWKMSDSWKRFEPGKGAYEVLNLCMAHCAIQTPISKATTILEIGAPGVVPDRPENPVFNCFAEVPALEPFRRELAGMSGLIAAVEYLRRTGARRDSLVNFMTYRLFNLPFKLADNTAQPHMNIITAKEAPMFGDFIAYERCDFPFFLVRAHWSADVEDFFVERHGPGIFEAHLKSAVAEGVLFEGEAELCLHNPIHLTSLGCGHLPVGLFCDVVEAAGRATLRFLRDHSGRLFNAGQFQVVIIGFEKIVNLLLERELLTRGKVLNTDDFGCWTLISETGQYVRGVAAD